MEGEPYKLPFEAFQVKLGVFHSKYLQLIENDNVLLKEWIQPACKELWQHLLEIAENKDLGYFD